MISLYYQQLYYIFHKFQRNPISLVYAAINEYYIDSASGVCNIRLQFNASKRLSLHAKGQNNGYLSVKFLT